VLGAAAPIVDEKRLADAGTSAIDQLALAHLINTGTYERHVRKMRLVNRRRRDHLVMLLAQRVPTIRVAGLSAGLHAILHLPPDGPGEPEVIAHAARCGVLIGALGAGWHRDGAHPQAVLVSYAAPPAHAFPAGMDRLVTALAEALR
jgi:GntR family transcriptional regulator/MocR family aminotransferase